MQATRFNHVSVHVRNLEQSDSTPQTGDALTATLYLPKAGP